MSQKTNDPLLFMHITKTAGGSIKKLLAEHLGDSCVFYNESNTDIDIAELSKGKEVVFGHYAFGLHNSIKLEPRYCCFLRNPVNRTISHYYHLFNNDSGPVGDKIRSGGEDINEFFMQSSHWEFSNFMCKVIGGYPRNTQLREDRSICRIAISNLRKMDYVGIFEYMDLSMLKLGEYLDLSKEPVLGQVNLGKYKLAGVSKETILEILRLNRWDQLLYEVGTEHFWKVLSKNYK